MNLIFMSTTLPTPSMNRLTNMLYALNNLTLNATMSHAMLKSCASNARVQVEHIDCNKP